MNFSQNVETVLSHCYPYTFFILTTGLLERSMYPFILLYGSVNTIRKLLIVDYAHKLFRNSFGSLSIIFKSSGYVV